MLAALVGWSITDLVILAIVIGAVVAIGWIALKAMGLKLPPWAEQMLLVVVIAIVAILAIHLVVLVW